MCSGSACECECGGVRESGVRSAGRNGVAFHFFHFKIHLCCDRVTTRHDLQLNSTLLATPIASPLRVCMHEPRAHTEMWK